MQILQLKIRNMSKNKKKIVFDNLIVQGYGSVNKIYKKDFPSVIIKLIR